MEFPVSTELSFFNGRPHIIVNGESIPPLIYGLSDIPASRTSTVQAKRNIANFAKAGINLVQIDTDLRLCWLLPRMNDGTNDILILHNKSSFPSESPGGQKSGEPPRPASYRQHTGCLEHSLAQHSGPHPDYAAYHSILSAPHRQIPRPQSQS